MITHRRIASLLAVTLILLLAAATRIHHIDGPALWTDEGFTYYTFKIDLFDALSNDRHPPFYFYTLHAWVELAGDSILAMRYWSFLPSLLSIAVAYQIGRALLRHRPGVAARSGALSLPVLAALMLALADGENYLAQELRMYTWHVLFAAASTLFYLKLVYRLSTKPPPLSLKTREGEKRGWLRVFMSPLHLLERGPRGEVICWILANTLLIYTHYFGVYVMVAQGLHALLFLRGQARIRAVLALAAVGLLFAPWFFAVTVRQFAQDTVCINCASPDNWQRLQEFPTLWFGQMWALMGILFVLGVVTSVNFMTRHHPLALSSMPGDGEQSRLQRFWKSALHLLESGFGGEVKDNHVAVYQYPLSSLHLPTLLLLTILIPIAVTYVLGHQEDIFFPHRLSQITVPITLLLALGLANFQTPARAALVAALVLYGVATVDWYRIKVPWHDVTRLAADYAESGEMALAEVGPEESALMYYLDHLLPDGMTISTYPFWGNIDRFTYYEHLLPPLIAEQNIAQPDAVKTIWLIYFSPDPGMKHKVEDAGYVRTMTRTLPHIGDSVISVYRYDKLPIAPLAAFESGMTLRAAEINPQSLRIDLWWSADTTPDRDYVVSAFLLDEHGVLVAQIDSPPFNGERPTRTWAPGEVIYDPRTLQLVNGLHELPPGSYTIGVRVYTFAPDGSLQIFPPTSSDADYWTIGAM